jgi:hypothetical protein
MGHFTKQTNSHLEKIYIFQNEPIQELGYTHQGIPEVIWIMVHVKNISLRNEAKFALSVGMQCLQRYFYLKG